MIGRRSFVAGSISNKGERPMTGPEHYAKADQHYSTMVSYAITILVGLVARP